MLTSLGRLYIHVVGCLFVGNAGLTPMLLWPLKILKSPDQTSPGQTRPKLKCHQNWNVIKTEMSPKLKCHQNWNVTKTEISPKLKCLQNWNVTKTEMSLTLKCQNVTKTEISSEMLQNLKMSSKSKSRRSALIILVLFILVNGKSHPGNYPTINISWFAKTISKQIFLRNLFIII